MDWTSTNTSNLSDLDPEELYLSLEAMGPGLQNFLVILYSCTALAALCGNGAAIAVFAAGQAKVHTVVPGQPGCVRHDHGRLLHPLHLHGLCAGQVGLPATVLPPSYSSCSTLL
ncbi:hypothetical protein CEXT_129051 [Caerostris extrusa]|uniref:G-protein coupled receptors family 1 profile domain-containing protein n=1 Tax=Caerostris extrusa TaxID=172846 RepID=A0AAV4Y0Z0_CAEEX|nr:hypothetical protein CEXT_129051 [Caerostris extrusa]